MEKFEKLVELSKYAQEQYEKSGTIITIEVIPLGISIRVTYRPEGGQLYQLLRVISTLELDVFDTQGLLDRLERMTREVHLKYVQVANSEKSPI